MPVILLYFKINCCSLLAGHFAKLSINSVMFPDERLCVRSRISKLHRFLKFSAMIVMPSMAASSSPEEGGAWLDGSRPIGEIGTGRLIEKSRTWRDVISASASGSWPYNLFPESMRSLRLVMFQNQQEAAG
ncbi:Os11g0564800 [Oryza sativa Japonica Group]|uniref:Os11g0564800 protein n=2 Tax=Oryza sativa subsp. japonica TaxID=39947 RepID=Q0IS47_ORYSJ|nr:hypothetical protein EE612_056198 [Oryza sativa]BAF28468.1 Os11g0564800 [Oryza sativa Japonica Group]BAT14490.1 Os11g0564800 [Oryza sativa Japonica Group]|eukprot:NP_001068105.1 Os11g0564800 [Oryza sativa Japonica Group]